MILETLLRGAATALVCTTLAGCADYQARREQEAAAQARADEAQDDADCRSSGAAPGSQEYVRCRMKIDNERAQARGRVAAQLLK